MHPLHRRTPIERIENRIDKLGRRASELLEQEQAALAKVEELGERAQAPSGRLSAARCARALRRAAKTAEQLRTRREWHVEEELRTIMIALERQSRRTRERLDQELERLAPIEAEWERLRSAFDALDKMVSAPALEQLELAGQWRGELEIPEFPVREREGYPKPFPARALLF
jgi:chromosome segregation ATPase